MGERKTYSLRLLPEIYTKLKILAAENGKTVSYLAEEAINDLIEKYKEK